ncbi:MAG TPA: glutamate-cysteine ligase family protein [Methanotrichaceae archaeon]|nr:glutamate-cysteine ligase family protein [Methanotrichaceae archaeon]
MKIGTEHEYSINDRDFKPLPISDQIIQRISGRIDDEVEFGGIKVSKELQKHVIELIPAKPSSISGLEENLYAGFKNLYQALNGEYSFLGLGMHPLLTLDQTTYWDHDEQEYYEVYDRLFNIRQHGWLNIQALQINIPYKDRKELVSMYNKLRSLVPYLIAVTASSPFVEGKSTGYADNRLIHYRENQKQIPLICGGILPQKIKSVDDYIKINRCIYDDLKKFNADILCREWVNSSGVIIRFTRKCLEIKALDEQECLHSDMAMTALILALLRSDIQLEEDESALKDMMAKAIKSGTEDLKPELERIYQKAIMVATEEEKRYLPVAKARIENGSLAEVLQRKYRETGNIKSLLPDLEASLRENRPYIK